MDFLDAKKQLQHRIILLLGYVLIAVGIVIGTVVLVYQAYGFGLAKNGTVIQNGLLFFSSQPHPAEIYINGKHQTGRTNVRLSLPANIYKVQLKRDGYQDWQRTIELDGGSVEHFDYPFLFPKHLDSKSIQSYAAPPVLATQSPDRRWLMIVQPNNLANFTVYDLKNPEKPATTLVLPDGLLSNPATSETWQLEEWADDNQHVILQHNYDNTSEFILVDRINPERSLNIDRTLNTHPDKLTLKDKKYDQYYLYKLADQSLQSASLKALTPQPVLSKVLAYHSYGNNTLLYATPSGAPTGTVAVKLVNGNQTSEVRHLPVGTNYLLDLTKYSGTFYVVIGVDTSDRVYIFKDPAGQYNQDSHHVVVPTQVLHVTQPNHVSFSASAQFIMAESGTRFGVYDIENKTGYNYIRDSVLDAPQAYAVWMDGNRLTYTSQGKLQVFDYDNQNSQTLGAAHGNYMPFFAPNYKFLDLIAPTAASKQFNLVQTQLLIPADR